MKTTSLALKHSASSTHAAHRSKRRALGGGDTPSASSASSSEEGGAPALTAQQSNLALPSKLCAHIARFLLPPSQPENETPEALEQWRLRIRDSAPDCHHAAALNHEWRASLTNVLAAMAADMVRCWLETQPPHHWLPARATAANPLFLAPVPPLFDRVPDFADVAARLEGLLLKNCLRPQRFLRVFEVLLTQVFELARVAGLTAEQRERLQALPLTALALLYPRGLALDAGLFKNIALLVLRHSAGLCDRQRWQLLQDLWAVRKTHFPGQLEELDAPMEAAHQSLPHQLKQCQAYHEQIEDSWSTSGLDADVEQVRLNRRSRPAGPYALAVLMHIGRRHAATLNSGAPPHTVTPWPNAATPASLHEALLVSLQEVLHDAAAGTGEHTRAARAFLLSLLPLSLLQQAYKRLSNADRLQWADLQ